MEPDLQGAHRPVTFSVYLAVLGKDQKSPLAPESDEEKRAEAKKEEEKKKQLEVGNEQETELLTEWTQWNERLKDDKSSFYLSGASRVVVNNLKTLQTALKNLIQEAQRSNKKRLQEALKQFQDRVQEALNAENAIEKKFLEKQQAAEAKRMDRIDTTYAVMNEKWTAYTASLIRPATPVQSPSTSQATSPINVPKAAKYTIPTSRTGTPAPSTSISTTPTSPVSRSPSPELQNFTNQTNNATTAKPQALTPIQQVQARYAATHGDEPEVEEEEEENWE